MSMSNFLHISALNDPDSGRVSQPGYCWRDLEPLEAEE
jgi:hypothetical protein